jgi:hypothetical protein
MPLIVSDDRSPCLKQVSPAHPETHVVWDPAADKTFAVNDVDDDGSPYPSANPPDGAPHFSWSLRRAGTTTWEPIAGYGMLPSVVLPGGRFTIGDSVEVRDNSVPPNEHLDSCGDTAICPTACPERETWTIDYR